MPLAAYADLAPHALAGKTILSTANYYPHRDGRILQLDRLESTTAEYEQELLPDSVIVKAFSNIVSHHIPNLANSRPLTALPVASDDSESKERVSKVVNTLGFDAVDGGLSPSRGASSPNPALTQRFTPPTFTASPRAISTTLVPPSPQTAFANC